MNTIRQRHGVFPAFSVVFFLLAGLVAVGPVDAGDGTDFPTIGTVERHDDRLDRIIAPTARMERLADGFDWSEGPVWVRDGGYLLFSDVPQNTVFRWKEGAGISVFLKPSGYTGRTRSGGEPGSNGLVLDPQGRLVLCQHGDRRVARREGDDVRHPGRPLPGQAVQQPQRRDLQVQRRPLLHRPPLRPARA